MKYYNLEGGYSHHLKYSNRWQNWPRRAYHFWTPPRSGYMLNRRQEAMTILDSCLVAMFKARFGKYKLDNAVRLHNSGERIKAIKAFRALHPGMTIRDAKKGIEAEVSLIDNYRR